MPDPTPPPAPPAPTGSTIPPAPVEFYSTTPSAPPAEPPEPESPDHLAAALAETRRQLTLIDRHRQALHALHEAGVIDLDAGIALLEETIKADAFDPADAVRQLKARKPALFRAQSPAPAPTHAHPRPHSAAMAPAPPHDHDARAELLEAAERAAVTGDRRALMTYLRLKRALA